MAQQDQQENGSSRSQPSADAQERSPVKPLSDGKVFEAQIASAEPVYEQRKAHEVGGYYVGQFSDGSILARESATGSRDSALAFTDAQAAYDYFRPTISTSHAAWNLCYALEDLIADEEA